MITLKNVTIFTEEGILENAYIRFDSTVHEIGQGDVEGLDMQGKLLIPGFIDQHTHGLMGHDAMDGTVEAIEVIANKLPLEGTTSFLATTMTETKEVIKKALGAIKKYNDNQTAGNAEMLGVHLEGPFISEVYKGAQRGDAIQEVSIELFKEYLEASGDLIKQVTIAPELNNAQELIKFMSANSIVSSIGHTNTSGEEALKAIKNGATCFTHAYNGMRKYHHRNIGAVGAMFLNDDAYAEVICDRIHSTENAMKVLFKAKGVERIILVTDGMRAKLLGEGEFDLGGQKVIVKDHQARLENGALAGSTLFMDHAVRNVLDFTEYSIYDVIQMASVNPAQLHGLYHKKGSIAVGKDADLLLVDKEINILETYCKGVKRLK